MARAEWSQQARRDLIAIFRYIAKDNPSAARQMLARLRKSERAVLDNPLMGRVVPEFEVANIRERIIAPYRVIYQVQRTTIVFLAVIHSRQDLARFDSVGDDD